LPRLARGFAFLERRMADLFHELAPTLLRIEGGYANNPNDAGGETNFGITKAVARANGYTGPMRDMRCDQALAIYRAEYWARPGFQVVGEIAPKVAGELLDTGVNMGVGTASIFLQRALNVLNRRARDYADIKVDGWIGAKTIAALNGLIAVRGQDRAEAVLLKMLNCLQGARYVELGEQRAENEEFELGWFENRIGLAA
jgi:lysozyme family protein